MFMALEALCDGGVKMGLERATATRLATQMMMVGYDIIMLLLLYYIIIYYIVIIIDYIVIL